ncbi:EcsC family protein [Anaerotignum lactatifermentans]|uniref:EcsC family protein n=1 Tax=Anaerotignum lactatifermentans TaxID=160404 RepID=UPI00255CAE2A|nr:EcsC family protein [Anaerotignum lactatifermentans]
MKQQWNNEEFPHILEELYQKVLSGIPKVSKSVEELAEDYLKKHDTVEEAAKALINNQIAKCGTSGFLTGLGGVLTLPVAIPANVSQVLYVQMRMVAALAYMGGFAVDSDQVQTLVYACLTGNAVSNVVKQTGIRAGEKVTMAAIQKIPGKVLIEINKKIGFRLLAKSGTKSVVILGKLVPVAGGVIGGAFDIGSTRIISANAYRLFITKRLPEEK